VEVEEAGNYQLSLSYAAKDPRPVSINVNGQVINDNAASAPTGGWFEGNRTSSNEGIIPLKVGTNSILISYFERIRLPAFTLTYCEGAAVIYRT